MLAVLAVFVVVVKTASLAEISTPSTVSVPDMTMLPVIVPPAFGKAAFAVVVVEVSTPSLVAISTPSTVPPTIILLAKVTLLLESSTTALDAGRVQKTSFVPALKFTLFVLLSEFAKTVVRDNVSGVPAVTVPIPTSNSAPPCKTIQ